MENIKQTSLETRRFYKRINKGGNFDFFCENLEDLIFNKLGGKKSKTNLDMFLTNYIAMVCDELNIDFVDVYFNYNTRVADQPEGFVDIENKVNLPMDILTSLKCNVFEDLVIIAHELKHVQIENNNTKIIRKIGNNSEDYIFSTCLKLLENLGFSKKERAMFYYFNKNEKLANEFSYNYVFDLIEKLENKKELEINKTSLLSVFKINVDAEYKHIKKIWKDGVDSYNLILIPKLFNMQEACFKNTIRYVDLMQKNYQNKKLYESYFNESIYLVSTLFESLNVIQNPSVINNIKKYVNNNYYKSPITIILMEKLINIPNYVVKKEDLNLLIKCYKFFDIPINFETIDIDRKNLIENYVDLAVDFENASFTKEEFFEKTDLTKIKNNVMLENKLLEFHSKKIQEMFKNKFNKDFEK